MTDRPAAPAAILETALYADDLAAAESFYAGLLGLGIVRAEAGRHVFFRCGPGMLLVFRPAATETGPPEETLYPVPAHGARGPGHAAFAATAAEIEAWAAVLPANGHPIDADFRWPTGARSLYVRDPAGNSVEFAEPRLWGGGAPLRLWDVWADPAEGACTTPSETLAEHRDRGMIPSDQVRHGTIEARTHEEAMAILHLRMRWEPYAPVGDPAPCPAGCGGTVYPQGSGQCPVCGGAG